MYRDDLEAARAKIEQLEERLEEAQQEVAQLKAPKSPAPIEAAHPEQAPRKPQPRALGRSIYYDPPRTYVPLLVLLRVAALAAWHRMPKVPELSSDNLLLILGHRLVLWPLVQVWRPVYVACLALLVLPAAAAIAVVGTALLFPVIVLARLRVGDVSQRSSTGDGWPQGDYDEKAGAIALWILMSIGMQPLLPVFIPLLKDD